MSDVVAAKLSVTRLSFDRIIPFSFFLKDNEPIPDETILDSLPE
jgi:hypothetical protein